MTDTKSYMITTPIYYVNDKPHIGHAYTTLACDVMARYKRLMGREVFFLTGTDEHGQKVEKSAAVRGVAPLAFADSVSQQFHALADEMHFSYDDFIRTTEPRHKIAAQALWKKIKANGYIYEDSYAGWYSVRDEAFYGEDELIADADGQKLAPTGAPVEWVEEPSYFFKLSAFQEKLLAYYEAHPDFIAPTSRRNEVMSFVRGGKERVEGALKDLSISRTSFQWGVPVPIEKPSDEKHVMYVWLDALTNYLTAAGYPDVESAAFKARWPADLHVVGKDILRFHAVYWPAFLMAADLPLPTRIVAHGWWTNEGQKISKSLGNVIDPHALVETYGLDAVRYFMMREVPFGNDGNFSDEAMIHRINSDLANNIGNLAQRTLSIIFKNCDATIPPVPATLTEEDAALSQAAEAVLAAYHAAMEGQRFHEALGETMKFAGLLNEYIDKQAPWALRKTDEARMADVLHVLSVHILQVALLLQPFMPDAMAKLLSVFAYAPAGNGLVLVDGAALAGKTIEKPTPIFPRFEAADKAA